MFCSLSGEACEDPVISPKSGAIFERRVIEKHLNTDGTDPATHEPLSVDDLISVRVNKVVKPKPATATSIPALLSTFQNEWDAVMLETYTLKQQLESVRQELSHALYQHDAACRVIARLIKERDDARSALANFKGTEVAAPAQAESMEVENGIHEEARGKMVARSTELSAERKKRQASVALAKAEDLKEYRAISSNNLHKASNPGVTTIDLHPAEDLLLSGGRDGQALVYSRSAGKIVNTLAEHKKTVTQVLFHPTQQLALTASADGTAKVWNLAEGKGKSIFTVTTHNGEVTGCTLQATGDYWLTSSLDGSWAFHDIPNGRTLTQVSADVGLSCTSFHPDGLILATGGVDSRVKVWDIKSQKNVATFEGHRGKVVDLSFSENGYYLATAAEDNTVKLWDLRKLKNFQTVTLPEDYNLSAVDFDYSGTYLAVAGNDIRVYVGKTLSGVHTYTEHTSTVTDVKWGRDAHSFVSSSLDRSIKVWGKK